MKTSYIMNTFWYRPRPNSLHFTFINTDPIGGHHITQKSHLLCEKGALLKVTIQLFFLKYPHNFGEVGLVLF